MTDKQTSKETPMGSAPRAVALLILVAAVPGIVWGQPPPTSQPPSTTSVPDDATEETLIARIRRMETLADEKPADKRGVTLRIIARQALLSHLDALAARFPGSAFEGQALVIKLKTLAALSRTHPTYLGLLLSETTRIAAGHPKEPLAAENDFYAIQAFVLAARREGMPAERRVLGTIERYGAFLADHAKSSHVPVIRASLVRGLLSRKLVDRAAAEVALLRRDFPDHKATRRAAGQLFLATAVGKPFAFTHTTSDGQTIRTADRLGKVLIVHFWAGRDKRSTAGLSELVSLYKAFHDKGLALIGVNVDRDRKRMTQAMAEHEMPWPQYFDQKGFENEVLVDTGVVDIPTYLVVDRKGILRAIPPVTRLRELVERLLADK